MRPEEMRTIGGEDRHINARHNKLKEERIAKAPRNFRRLNYEKAKYSGVRIDKMVIPF